MKTVENSYALASSVRDLNCRGIHLRWSFSLSLFDQRGSSAESVLAIDLEAGAVLDDNLTGAQAAGGAVAQHAVLGLDGAGEAAVVGRQRQRVSGLFEDGAGAKDGAADGNIHRLEEPEGTIDIGRSAEVVGIGVGEGQSAAVEIEALAEAVGGAVGEGDCATVKRECGIEGVGAGVGENKRTVVHRKAGRQGGRIGVGKGERDRVD